MQRWKGRVAIVTGASAGIGEAIAISLAENGLKVVGVARRTDRLQELSKKYNNIQGVQCDITKEEDIINAVKWTRKNLGGADVLVNNAGVLRFCPLGDFKTEDFKLQMDTNVLGLSIFTREVIKDMQDRKVNDGHIFHINSNSGQRIMDFPGAFFTYSATKHCVTVLTEGLRRELRDLGTKIRVTSISPGLVKTEIVEARGGTLEEKEQLFGENPYLNPKDIADALIYALSTPAHVQVHEITIQPIGSTG